MYLSRISVDLERVRSIHRLVMRGFPGSPSKTPRADWNILYRIDGRFILVQSDIAPNWGEALPTEAWETRKYDVGIAPGERYRFRMTVNPVTQREGKRTPITVESWLERRDIGAELSVQSTHYHTIRDYSGSQSRHPIVVEACTVEGLLTVADCSRLEQVIRSGLGRSRAYGCGLLSVVRLTHNPSKIAETQ